MSLKNTVLAAERLRCIASWAGWGLDHDGGNTDWKIVAKTRTQLNQRLSGADKLPWPKFGPAWYAGCTTLIIGNSLKAGVRFVAFDQFKSMLQDENGHISGPRTVIAGFGAGVTESLLAVTPFESIKTTL